MLEQRFKEYDEENHADIWMQGSVSSRGKSKYRGREFGEFLRLARRPGRLDPVRGRVNCRAEDEEIMESNYVDYYKAFGFFSGTSQDLGVWG